MGCYPAGVCNEFDFAKKSIAQEVNSAEELFARKNNLLRVARREGDFPANSVEDNSPVNWRCRAALGHGGHAPGAYRRTHPPGF